jgi:predicted SAM-dependent methyltransferase
MYTLITEEPGTQLPFTILGKLHYPDNSVELIETYPVIEHLPMNDFQKILKEWNRLLRPAASC